MCGIVGLKPTRARTTLGPDYGEYWGPLTHEFVLTRSIRDTARVLDCVAGPGPGDPYTAPAPARAYRKEVGAPPGKLRIGYRTDPGASGPAHADCVTAVEQSAKLLEQLGHDVELTDLVALDEPIDQFINVMGVAIAADVARWSARLGRDIMGDLEPMNQFLAMAGAGVSATSYVAAIEEAQAWSRGIAAFWDDHDILVLPTSPDPPLRVGEIGPNNTDPDLGIRMSRVVTFAWPFDVTGQPAISLPLHWTDDGLPIGVQLIAAYGREDVLLRLGAQLEEAQPWAERWPPVHA
jgi:amidase